MNQYPTDPHKFEILLDQIIKSNNYREYKKTINYILDNYYENNNILLKMKSSIYYNRVSREKYVEYYNYPYDIKNDKHWVIMTETDIETKGIYYLYQYFLSISKCNICTLYEYTKECGEENKKIHIILDDDNNLNSKLTEYLFYTSTMYNGMILSIKGKEIEDHTYKTFTEPLLQPNSNDYFTLDSFIRKFKISNILSR